MTTHNVVELELSSSPVLDSALLILMAGAAVGDLLAAKPRVGADVGVGGGVGSAVVDGGVRVGVGAPGTPGHPIKGAASALHWQQIPSAADPKKAVVLP